jgi:hypothetical protein
LGSPVASASAGFMDLTFRSASPRFHSVSVLAAGHR